MVASEAQPSTEKAETEPTVEDIEASLPAPESQTTESSDSEDPSPTAVPGASLQSSTALQAPAVSEKKAPRKLIDEEKRAVGRVALDIWGIYFKASGNLLFWICFIAFFALTALGPVFENGWLG